VEKTEKGGSLRGKGDVDGKGKSLLNPIPPRTFCFKRLKGKKEKNCLKPRGEGLRKEGEVCLGRALGNPEPRSAGPLT